MQTALYLLWILIPLFFFLLALWSALEKVGGGTGKPSGGDYFRQGLFVSACVGICILIDRTVLPDIAAAIAPDYVPLGVYQAVLLPAVLYLGAVVFGGSKDIMIGKAPHPSQVKKKR